MGTPVPDVPDDYGYGEDCLACWPAGKTPNYVFIRFWDVVACPGCPEVPNGYAFICAQDPIDACYFHGQLTFAGYLWTAHWYTDFFTPGGRKSEITLSAAGSPCTGPFYQRDEPCTQDYDNANVDCAGIRGGKNGRCHITVYVDPIIIVLTSEAHLVVLPGSQYERWDVGMDHSIYRIANKTDHTNIMVYIEREVIEAGEGG